MGTWNPARLSPVIFTAVIAILVFGVVILAIGVFGVWMLDRRGRQTA